MQCGTTIRSLLRSGAVFPINGRMRDEFVNETLFHGLPHARAVIGEWVEDYNTERPHSALGYQAPKAFARQLTTATGRPAELLEGSAEHPVAPPAPIGVSTQRTQVPAG
jgi:hypothetical protein